MNCTGHPAPSWDTVGVVFRALAPEELIGVVDWVVSVPDPAHISGFGVRTIRVDSGSRSTRSSRSSSGFCLLSPLIISLGSSLVFEGFESCVDGCSGSGSPVIANGGIKEGLSSWGNRSCDDEIGTNQEFFEAQVGLPSNVNVLQ